MKIQVKSDDKTTRQEQVHVIGVGPQKKIQIRTHEDSVKQEPLQSTGRIILHKAGGKSDNSDPESTVVVGNIQATNFNARDIVWIVDGKETSYEEVTSISPQDIESMAVLKDDKIIITLKDSQSCDKSIEGLKVYTDVDQKPEFPGGEMAMMKWLCDNLKYPETAAKNKIQERVVVSFIVEQSGKIRDCKIEAGKDEDLCKEALRVVGEMPNWIPAKVQNKAVSCMHTLPITFKLK